MPHISNSRSARLCATGLTACCLVILSILISCSSPKLPTGNVSDSKEVPAITPDYTSVTVPPNIAPMNFDIDIPGDEYVASVTGKGGKSLIASGKTIRWDMDGWHDLLDDSKGSDLAYEIYVRNGDSWKRYRFTQHVAPEVIDTYISYRLIEPSFVQYAGITINQRDLTSFDESVVYNNAAPADERRGQCMNCHVPRNQYRDHASQLHIRNRGGGTVVMAGDSVVKVNLKTDSTLSAGVYPAWHPNLDLIAYSTNTTEQKFFNKGEAQVEVYDRASGLILYDMKTHEVATIADDPDLLETFPAWSPDGKRLYYSVARYPEGVTSENLPEHHTEIHYDIVSRDFDPATRRFSEPDTAVNAAAEGMSALLPRISPDGKYLLYCKAPFGTFHIWHKESDLWIKDLATGSERPLSDANSPDTDSYHSWSSNGRWIVFSSRRDDGSFTRPYITYISPSGSDTKAFVVPQETPQYYRDLMKSYNVPEFFVEPFAQCRSAILEQVNDTARQAPYKR